MQEKKDILEIFEQIRIMGKSPGLALMLSTEIDSIIDLIKKADYVLLLTINEHV